MTHLYIEYTEIYGDTPGIAVHVKFSLYIELIEIDGNTPGMVVLVKLSSI
jgi:hypothetical protein